MNCPSCQGPLGAAGERCAACGAIVAPVVMGALAPDPSRATPPSRGPAPLRDVPGLRKREKVQPAWKDEVRERMRQRKRKNQPDAELPLFPEAAVSAVEPVAAVAVEAPMLPPLSVESPLPTAPLADAASEFQAEPAPFFDEPEELPAPVAELRLGVPRPAPPDLPLRRFDLPARSEPEPATARTWDQAEEEPFEDAARLEPDWTDEDDALASVGEAPIERPARFAERLEAGAVDAVILGGLYAVVVYFASRAAHTSVAGLTVAWPWLAAYLAFLGLAYAAWFTGMRGQTPGKMMFGLLVLTQAGERLGWGPAVARAAAGAAGISLAGLGMLPLFFDPARRALHDRLVRTRVVKV